MIGTTTWVNVCAQVPPATREASSSSAPSCIMLLLMICVPSVIELTTTAMISTAIVPYSGRSNGERKTYIRPTPNSRPGTAKGSHDTKSSSARRRSLLRTVK
jgi:hypothetical protein